MTNKLTKLYLENSLNLNDSLLIVPHYVNSELYRFVPNKIFVGNGKIENIILENPSSKIHNLIIDTRIELDKYSDILRSLFLKTPFRKLDNITIVETCGLGKHEYFYLDFPYSIVSSLNYDRIKEVLNFGSTRYVIKPLWGSRNLGVIIVELNKLFELSRASFVNKCLNLKSKLSSRELLLKFFSELGAVVLFDLDTVSEDDLDYLVRAYFEGKGFTIQPYVEGVDIRIVGNHKGDFEVLTPSDFNKNELKTTVREILVHLEKLKIFYPFYTMDFRLERNTNKLFLLEVQTGSIINQSYGVEKYLKVLN